MSQTRNQQAYQRGVRIARMWKRLKSTILRWDSFCVSKASKHKLPTWLGHVPITCLVAVSAISGLTGGLLVAIVILFGWALLLLPSMMELLKPTVNVKVTNWEEESHKCNYGSNGSNGSDGSTGS
ncbi:MULTISPECIES: hypothetical protein [Serratia]|uniref:hypothetical protein n=1 Tax=Serratia TaxID=613 RepID=UPI00020E97B9|nr:MULTISPECIES: hypothetical protein [Serratia]AEF43466.1 hypothetical protein SerAS9_0304 [Serratia plymuthica AS9]AEF48418.1 hypothetical protein SerAS12_0304 [Serratia sp. AS12]AEG26126.1 hypothetical protein SerAS13_0303 [Serratia sp. AS13]UTN97030.1 hypothetical protein NLX81_01610 [Serratia plymuthica]